MLALGGVTAVMGVLYALMQHDLKRLLAYTRSRISASFLSDSGLALAFKAIDMPPAAALALTAALFHVFNHSLFKSLLFFGAGAVLTATGERDMEHLGGLIHRMPRDGTCFSGRLRRHLGSAAIQRLCFRMADLSGDPAESRIAAMGSQAVRARSRRIAGAVGGAGCRLLRQGLRHHVSRPSAQTAAAEARRDRSLLAAAHVGIWRCYACSPAFCPVSSSIGLAPVAQSLVGRPHAAAVRGRLALAGADQQEPKFL